jgi:hypothetical protein
MTFDLLIERSKADIQQTTHILPFGALLAIRNSGHLFSAKFVHAA